MGTDEINDLVSAAEQAVHYAQASYSRFRVGAALMTGEGRIYTGCNIENPTLMLTNCAERVAIQKALSEGERGFRAIAIAASSGEKCFPCGACRQMLMEYAPDADVFLVVKHALYKYSVNELLPHAFMKESIG